MSQAMAAEILRRVEEAPLERFVEVSIEEVQVQMDAYLDPRYDPMALYQRAERQHWRVEDLDFSNDAMQWAALDDYTRAVIRRILTLFFIGEQAVTDTLSPILHAAPHEDERIFLATQMADEARHAVFFHRFFAEVLEVQGGLRAALDVVGPDATAGFTKIFDEHLVPSTDRVRREPENPAAWSEAVATYHLLIEGFLAVTGQRNLLRFTRATGFMPGFHTGFTAVARDESRHIGFGVLALRRRVQDDPEMARVIVRQLLELAEPAVETMVEPGTRVDMPPPDDLPPEQRQSPLEVRDYAQGQLARRMRAIGLSEEVIDEVRGAFLDRYEPNWAAYEANHGVEHPVRWYQRQAAAAGEA